MNFLIMPGKLLHCVHICYLTGDASAPSEMEDPDIVIDLRELNHSTSDKFSLLWEQCNAEVPAVHERRHDQVTYLAPAISVCDLIERVKKRCPKGIPIPSEQWT